MTTASLAPLQELDNSIHTGERSVVPSHWLNVVSHLDPKYGGLSTVVPQLCSSIQAQGLATTSLAAFCASDERPQDFGVPVHYWPPSRLDWVRNRTLSERFREQARASDGLHIHGLWEQSTDIAARTARELRKPYLISAHGMLEPWALNNKRWKKLLYAALREHTNVRSANCLHALTNAEAEDYRRFGSRVPIAVIPNAVSVPAVLDADAFFARYPHLRGSRIVLFLGRIHFKKGLDILAKAWASVAERWPEAHLVLAGPDSESTQRNVEKEIQTLKIEDRVTFTGMLDSRMKWSALAAAECFVLPSYSEGLSTSVLEAMGAGLPVIVSRQCHMPEVALAQAGWQIEANAGVLAEALNEFLRGTQAVNRDIGARGRRLIESNYSWHSVASRMGELYQWMAGGDVPTSFEVMGAAR